VRRMGLQAATERWGTRAEIDDLVRPIASGLTRRGLPKEDRRALTPCVGCSRTAGDPTDSAAHAGRGPVRRFLARHGRRAPVQPAVAFLAVTDDPVLRAHALREQAATRTFARLGARRARRDPRTYARVAPTLVTGRARSNASMPDATVIARGRRRVRWSAHAHHAPEILEVGPEAECVGPACTPRRNDTNAAPAHAPAAVVTQDGGIARGAEPRDRATSSVVQPRTPRITRERRRTRLAAELSGDRIASDVVRIARAVVVEVAIRPHGVASEVRATELLGARPSVPALSISTGGVGRAGAADVGLAGARAGRVAVRTQRAVRPTRRYETRRSDRGQRRDRDARRVHAELPGVALTIVPAARAARDGAGLADQALLTRQGRARLPLDSLNTLGAAGRTCEAAPVVIARRACAVGGLTVGAPRHRLGDGSEARARFPHVSRLVEGIDRPVATPRPLQGTQAVQATRGRVRIESNDAAREAITRSRAIDPHGRAF
jgi:hypothetical protein